MKKLLLFSALLLLGKTGYGQCTAGITYTASGTTYNFTDASSGGMTLYNWDFGDGGSSWLQNPTHTFLASGNYTVCLYVEDSIAGCSDTVCVPITVIDSTAIPCDADFSISIAGSTVDFSNTSSGSNLNYYWDFGDGTDSYAINPSHTYTSNGSYYACLTIWSNDSLSTCSDYACQNITIFDSTASPCNANFTFTTGNTDAYFTSSSAGTGLFHSWNFGDGTTSNLENPSHIYTSNGLFNVCLTVSSNDSLNPCSDTICHDIWIFDSTGAPCNANFTFTTGSLDANFYSSSAGTGHSHFWDFGDGATSNLENPSHVFASNGDYYVCLTVSSNDSLNPCSETVCDTVSILDTISGLNDLGLNNVNIYPNPANDFVNVSIEGGITTGKIRLVDLTGREMKLTTIETEITRIGLSDIPDGMYMVQLFDENNQLRLTKKFCKK